MSLFAYKTKSFLNISCNVKQQHDDTHWKTDLNRLPYLYLDGKSIRHEDLNRRLQASQIRVQDIPIQERIHQNDFMFSTTNAVTSHLAKKEYLLGNSGIRVWHNFQIQKNNLFVTENVTILTIRDFNTNIIAEKKKGIINIKTTYIIANNTAVLDNIKITPKNLSLVKEYFHDKRSLKQKIKDFFYQLIYPIKSAIKILTCKCT